MAAHRSRRSSRTLIVQTPAARAETGDSSLPPPSARNRVLFPTPAFPKIPPLTVSRAPRKEFPRTGPARAGQPRKSATSRGRTFPGGKTPENRPGRGSGCSPSPGSGGNRTPRSSGPRTRRYRRSWSSSPPRLPPAVRPTRRMPPGGFRTGTASRAPRERRRSRSDGGTGTDPPRRRTPRGRRSTSPCDRDGAKCPPGRSRSAEGGASAPPHLAPGRRDKVDLRPFVGVFRDRPPRAEGFVVGMGEKEQDPFLHVGVALNGAIFPLIFYHITKDSPLAPAEGIRKEEGRRVGRRPSSSGRCGRPPSPCRRFVASRLPDAPYQLYPDSPCWVRSRPITSSSLVTRKPMILSRAIRSRRLTTEEYRRQTPAASACRASR